jgi:hypothetical protein
MDMLLNALNTVSSDDEFKSRSQAYVANNHVLNSKRIKEIDGLFKRLLNVPQNTDRN